MLSPSASVLSFLQKVPFEFKNISVGMKIKIFNCCLFYCLIVHIYSIGSELLAKGALANLKISSQGMKIKFLLFACLFGSTNFQSQVLAKGVWFSMLAS